MSGISAAGYNPFSFDWNRTYYDKNLPAASLASANRSDSSDMPGVPAGGAAASEHIAVGLPGSFWETKLPGVEDLNNPSELIARMRIQLPGSDDEAGEMDSLAKVTDETECQTCANRKYQDGSDDPGVSFKSPTNLSPEQAASAVRGHEQEHVVREQAKAEREGRKVISQSVSIHTDICPECGRVYISGGVTHTVTASDIQSDSAQQLSVQPKSKSAA